MWYDFLLMSSRANLEAASHAQSLLDEEMGTRHRIQHYYLPKFSNYCASRNVAPDQVRVLDCGCGNGLAVELLVKEGFFACGIDMSPIRREQWSQRQTVTALVMANAVSLPFASAHFDIVLSCGLIEHIGVFEEGQPRYRVAPLPSQFELRRQFVSECLRVMKPGGIFYLDHPNGAFPIDFWHNDYRCLPRVHRPGEKFLPTFSEVVRLVREVDPTCSVEAIAPAGRFTFRRVRRRWYGRLLSGPVEHLLGLMQSWPFSLLAGSSINPYLVSRITRKAMGCSGSAAKCSGSCGGYRQ
jgi:SAM-dependent methyltransferase